MLNQVFAILDSLYPFLQVGDSHSPLKAHLSECINKVTAGATALNSTGTYEKLRDGLPELSM
jgi:hypothetical protein